MMEMMKKIVNFGNYITPNIYNLVDTNSLNGYTIVFGNLNWGYHISDDKELLIKLWKYCIHLSQAKFYGDITLFYNCKLIRGINNANISILMKPHGDPERYDIKPYVCNKYKIKI